MSRREKSLVGLGVGIALLVLALVYGPLGRPEVAGTVEESGRLEKPRLSALTKRGTRPGGSSSHRSVVLKSTEAPAGQFDPYEEWDTQKIVEHFGLAPGEFHGAQMGEIVDYLRRVYEENGGRKIAFRVEGGGGPPVSCEFGNVSVRSFMELVTGLGGYELEVGDGEIVFRRRPESSVAGLQRLQISGDVSGRLRKLEAPRDGESSEEAAKAIRDAFAKYGIGFGEGSGVEIDELGNLSITNAAAENDRIQAVYKFLMGSSSPGQVLVTSKGVAASPELAGFSAESYTDPEFQVEIRRISQIRGASLISNPSVVTTGGQRARVELVREVIYPTAWEDGKPALFETKNVGVMLEFTPTLVGLDRVELGGLVDHTTVGEQTLEDLVQDGGRTARPDGDVDGGDFRSHTAEFEGLIIDGNTAAFLAAEDGEVGVQQFITVRRILPDGQPLLPK